MDGVARVCTKEEPLDETPAKAGGVPCDSLAEKVCIKKAWALCREAFATGRHGQPASQTEQEDQALPDEVKRSLDGQWEASHGFVLNAFRLLSETQQNKIYRMSHGAPRAFPIVLLESMRLLCRLSDGKSVKSGSSSKVMNSTEHVSGVFEFWTRLRAFFTTLAYTSIDQKEWFGFGECEQFVDQDFQWLHLRHGGQRAPIQFCIDAFNSTCAIFQSAVRASRTLNSVIGNPSEYQHFWTVFVPNSKGDNTVKSRERKGWREDPGTSDYKAGYEKALQAARNLQSERDRVVNELRKLSNESGKGKQYSGQKDRRRDRGPETSNHNVTSTHGNPDGSCMRSGASS